jgi:alkanesulfonate monooxygenase SsuD/methylene tetrahydromethanopterin reductase-like flavin-dependent oxidoreductase (luciferase family)
MRKLLFYYFHLMPYPELPADFRERHHSAWVTPSNALYDPERGHALYHRYLDELVRAEERGWDGVCVNEHHQNVYGTMPSPNLIAAILTQRTKRCRIGIIGNALPLHDDPLRVAEEIAMLDVISGGRIISGFVRGTGMEYYSYGVNPAHSRDRFYEAHDLILKAWTEPGPFPFVGKHYRYRYVNPWPRPLQKPHPPVWLPGTGSLETVAFAAERRYPFMMVYSPVAHQARAYGLYRRVAEEKFGYEAAPEQLAFCVPCYVAESDEIARREAEPHLMWLFRTGLKTGPFTIPPGYVSERSLKAMITAGAKPFAELTMDDLVNEGYVIVGSPDTVVEKLAHYTDVLHAGIMVSGAHWGDMPAEKVEKNMELFATQVMPQFRG